MTCGSVLDDEDEETHHIPVHDDHEHMISRECWCKPEQDEDGEFIHNAHDGRETAYFH